MQRIDTLARILISLFALDRLLKLIAVVDFFRRSRPAAPVPWPSVTLIQPVTKGASDLEGAMLARQQLDYPAPIQHLVVCDAADHDSQRACRALVAAGAADSSELVVVTNPGGTIATKIAKLQAALPRATGDILCFIDDDVIVRPESLRVLVRHVVQPQVGAVFGLACYINWHTIWSSLMSAFVNANALLSYIPITYLTEPFTITGHFFALRREVFARIGGLQQMEHRISDDHELGLRCQAAGLRLVQTPLVYDVTNDMPSWRAYRLQMRRWFVFPKQAMLPTMSAHDKRAMAIGSLGNLIPGILAMVALLTGRRAAWRGLGASLGIFSAVYLLCEWCYLRRVTPIRRWPLLPVVAILPPVQVVWTLLSGNDIEWRGRRMRIHRGGIIEAAE